jgi:hypothetical protein
MFKTPPDDRLTRWADFRLTLEESEDPLKDVAVFWKQAPLIPHNSKIDPYYQASWPTPWEIIVENRYDDFTLSVMMAYTLLYTDRYKDSKIEIKTLVDADNNRLYNVVYIDESMVLNFLDGEVVTADNVPSLYRLENLVTLERPR